MLPCRTILVTIKVNILSIIPQHASLYVCVSSKRRWFNSRKWTTHLFYLLSAQTVVFEIIRREYLLKEVALLGGHLNYYKAIDIIVHMMSMIYSSHFRTIESRLPFVG